MCHRFVPLTLFEAQSAVEARRSTGRARVSRAGADVEVPDAYPGSTVPLFVPDAKGELEATLLTWGFEGYSSSSRLLFNTRIETAVKHVQEGRGLWANAMAHGRCLLPVRGFFEHDTMGAERGVQVRFTLPGHGVFLLAAIHENGRFSVLTTRPNADVAPIHRRMPIVLGPGESSIWLGDGYEGLADRSRLPLVSVRA